MDKIILTLFVVSTLACNTDYEPLIVERIENSTGSYDGNCNVLIGDGNYNHSNSFRLQKCPCELFSVGDTLVLTQTKSK